MSKVITRMGFQASFVRKIHMVYVFDPLEVECFMPLHHEYPHHMLINLGSLKHVIVNI
jgi:hypothetical protein